MGRMLILLVVGLCATIARPCIAGAPGFDLAWGTCATTSASGNQSFSCNTEGAPFRLVMIFRSAWDIHDFAGVSIVLRVCTEAPTGIPDWWRFGTGDCREGAFAFPTATGGLGGECTDFWAGHDTGGGYAVLPGGSAARFDVRMDFATADTADVTAGVSYLAGVATLDQRRTVAGASGSPICTGCLEPVNLSLRSVELFGFGGEDYLVPYQGRPYVAWQGGTPEFPYCVPDATRNATWGAVKALYR